MLCVGATPEWSGLINDPWLFARLFGEPAIVAGQCVVRVFVLGQWTG